MQILVFSAMYILIHYNKTKEIEKKLEVEWTLDSWTGSHTTIHCRVEWYTVELLVIFENYEATQKNRRIGLRTRGACAEKFSLSKNHRDLKHVYFLLKIYCTVLQRTIAKKSKFNFLNYFFFDLVKGKPIILTFS